MYMECTNEVMNDIYFTLNYIKKYKMQFTKQLEIKSSQDGKVQNQQRYEKKKLKVNNEEENEHFLDKR